MCLQFVMGSLVSHLSRPKKEYFTCLTIRYENLISSYVVVSEAASTHIKEKTNLFAGVISILTTFLTSFTVPYLLKAPYANLGAKVGFIYGSLCTVMVVVAYLFIPELKGRSLEEVDQLFASGRPLREFKNIQTRPIDEPEHVLENSGKNGDVSTSVYIK
jgi:hypothetical protein